MNSNHAITPYGQVYGQHPRFFEFDRLGRMQPTSAGIMEELRAQEENDDVPETLSSQTPISTLGR